MSTPKLHSSHFNSSHQTVEPISKGSSSSSQDQKVIEAAAHALVQLMQGSSAEKKPLPVIDLVNSDSEDVVIIEEVVPQELSLNQPSRLGVQIPEDLQEHAQYICRRSLSSSYFQSCFGRLEVEELRGTKKAWISEGILDLYIPMLRKECSESQWVFPRCLTDTYKQFKRDSKRLVKFRERSLKKLLTQQEYDEQGKYQSTRTALPDPAKLKTIWLPVNHHNSHWYFIEIDLAGREYKIFDSKPGIADPEEGAQVAHWLVNQLMLGRYVDWVEGEWKFSIAAMPKQTNDYDCGAYMLRGIEERVHGNDTSAVGPSARQQVLSNLLRYDKELCKEQ